MRTGVSFKLDRLGSPDRYEAERPVSDGRCGGYFCTTSGEQARQIPFLAALDLDESVALPIAVIPSGNAGAGRASDDVYIDDVRSGRRRAERQIRSEWKARAVAAGACDRALFGRDA